MRFRILQIIQTHIPKNHKKSQKIVLKIAKMITRRETTESCKRLIY